ncbi:MAG: hypothetical protein ACYC1U_00455 [Candidatus Aquicultorales bacterium]
MQTKPGTKTAMVIALVVMGVLFVGGLGVYAADGTTNYSSIVDRLAKAFNLDPAKVNEVFDQERQERQAEAEKNFQERFENMLDQAVEDGEITAEQKEAIVSKMAELKSKREEINNSKLTFEERNEALASLQQDLRDWAEENDIDLRFLKFGIMGGKRGMMGGKGMMGGGRMQGFGGYGDGGYYQSAPAPVPDGGDL